MGAIRSPPCLGRRAGHRRLAGSSDGGVSAVLCLGFCRRPARLHDQRASDGAGPPDA